MNTSIAAHSKPNYGLSKGVGTVLRRCLQWDRDSDISSGTAERPGINERSEQTLGRYGGNHGSTQREVRDPIPTANRILLVEDDAGLRRSCARALTALGYHVEVAENGQRAWQALCAGSYALLITENSVPHLSGLELVGKARSGGMALPIILVSDRMGLLESDGAELLQVAVVLEKPFELPDLVDAVHYVLRSAPGLQRDPRRYVVALEATHSE